MLRVCREYKGYCYPMIGLHPTSVGADYEKELEIVARELASPNEFVAEMCIRDRYPVCYLSADSVIGLESDFR